MSTAEIRRVIAEQKVLGAPGWSAVGHKKLWRWYQWTCRILQRNTWHWSGVALWVMKQRHLRFWPLPWPSVSSTSEYRSQSRYADNKEKQTPGIVNAVLLKKLVEYRSRLGLKEAFLEHDAVRKAMSMSLMRTGTKANIAADAVTEKTKQLEQDGVVVGFGPKGGLPRTKPELILLCQQVGIEHHGLKVAELKAALQEFTKAVGSRTQGERRVDQGKFRLERSKAVEKGCGVGASPSRTFAASSSSMVVDTEQRRSDQALLVESHTLPFQEAVLAHPSAPVEVATIPHPEVLKQAVQAVMPSEGSMNAHTKMMVQQALALQVPPPPIEVTPMATPDMQRLIQEAAAAQVNQALGQWNSRLQHLPGQTVMMEQQHSQALSMMGNFVTGTGAVGDHQNGMVLPLAAGGVGSPESFHSPEAGGTPVGEGGLKPPATMGIGDDEEDLVETPCLNDGFYTTAPADV